MMSTIGHFRQSKSGGWEGELRTLTMNARLRLVPNDDRASPNAPIYRVMVGWSHVGDAWEMATKSDPPRTFYRLHLDDPRFDAPLSLALFIDEAGDNAQLAWSRPKKEKSPPPKAREESAGGAPERYQLGEEREPRESP